MSGLIWIAAAVVFQTGPAAKSFTSPQGRYTINMPVKPVEKTRNFSLGSSTVKLVVASTKKGVITYTSSFADIGSAEAEAALTAAKDDLVAQSKGEVKDESEANVDEYPGRSFTLEVPKKIVAGGAEVKGRAIVVGQRLFVLSTTVPLAKASASAAETDAFFSSFRPDKPAKLPAMAGNAKVKLGAPWKDFTPPGESIVLKMPGEVKDQSFTAQTPIGPVTAKVYFAAQENTAFMLIIAPSAELKPDHSNLTAFFQGFKGGLLQSQKATLVSERRLELGGCPIFEVTCELPAVAGSPYPSGATQICRCIVVKDASYTINTITPKGMAPSKDIAAFLDSFAPTNSNR